MCRNIKRLDNFKPPATEEEIGAAALQYVRKVSGTRKPSKANEAAFEATVEAITRLSSELLSEWVSTAPPRDREEEIKKARERWKKREARLHG